MNGANGVARVAPIFALQNPFHIDLLGLDTGWLRIRSPIGVAMQVANLASFSFLYVKWFRVSVAVIVILMHYAFIMLLVRVITL